LRRGLAASLGQLVSALQLITQHLSWRCTRDFGSSVQAGSYSVTETIPSNYTLTSIDCSASTTTHGSTTSGNTTTGALTIDLKAQDTIDCTYTNKLKVGALAIQKDSTKGGPVSQAGAVFSYDGHSVTDNGTGDEDPAVGSVASLGSRRVTTTSPRRRLRQATATLLIRGPRQPQWLLAATAPTTRPPERLS
jgi:hypothetical protein